MSVALRCRCRVCFWDTQPVIPPQVSLGAGMSKQREGYKQEFSASRVWWINHLGPLNKSPVHYAQLTVILILPASRIYRQGFDAVLPHSVTGVTMYLPYRC